MILYHGSNQLITKIDLSKSKNFKDFGRGFYLTKDYARAVAMAQRTTAIMGRWESGSVTVHLQPIKMPQRC